ncbi:hypothetical protein EDC01DRAFT_667947 [Geopyxis carbonaria]|nr:hypothetical protein EDC01DRAFT_667947 [Geopyxis carbonaria]
MTIQNGSSVSQRSQDSTSQSGPLPEPLAIVGMSCQLPGGSLSPESFWELLASGGSGYTDVPEHAFNISAFHHPDRQRPGALCSLGGNFLQEDTRDFDPSFFGISAAEAVELDPQQRKLLEAVFRCFESAGLPLDKVSGSSTGCYVGNFTQDMMRIQAGDLDHNKDLQCTGSALTMLSNRISNVFNLKGPSLTLDTACSSSMYALHYACQSLRARECDAMIVAATNLIFAPHQQLTTDKLGVLSPTSTCHTFDASADGYSRSEGVGSLYIKRLSDALKDGDAIRAVIRGTAVNANGKGKGLTTPDLKAQRDVIQSAYKSAGLELNNTGFFECHGTGTPVGDPIEVAAIGAVFSEIVDKPLPIGSVKTNVGHSEAASGISQIIKAVLCLEHGLIPPTIGLKNPNPNIDFVGANVRVVTETEKLQSPRISINSFGFGGANAHAIIESLDFTARDFPKARYARRKVSKEREDRLQNTGERRVLLFSGHDKPSLQAQIESTVSVLNSYSLSDLAHTLAFRRSHFFYRAYCIGNNVAAMKYGQKSKRQQSLGFVFTGQGAQWAQMGQELIVEYPEECRSILRRLDDALQSLPKGDAPHWTFELEFSKPAESSMVSEASHSQPMCTALQLMVIELLKSWGIRPSVTIGHSSGEIAAAACAGYITQAEAIIIAYYRGLAVSRHGTTYGGMLAATLSEREAVELLQTHKHWKQVSVACINSPSSVTLSGDALVIAELKSYFDQKKIFSRILQTNGRAYHSQHMLTVGPRYEDMYLTALEGLDLQPNEVPATPIQMFSTVSSQKVEHISTGYWRQNLESTVRFEEGLQNLMRASNPPDILIEIGPHSALEGPIKEILRGITSTAEYYPTIVRKQSAQLNLLRLAGDLWVRGHPSINMKKVNCESKRPPGAIVDLPPHQWTYTDKYWRENLASEEYRFKRHPRHDTLGSRIPGTSTLDYVWRNILSSGNLPWLVDHKIDGMIALPAAAHITMACEAIRQVTEDQAHEKGLESIPVVSSYTLTNVAVKRALFVPDGGREIQMTLKPHAMTAVNFSNSVYDFRICSRVEKSWVENCCGRIAVTTKELPSMDFSYGAQYDESAIQIPGDEAQWCPKLAKLGLELGPSFLGLQKIFTTPGVFQARSICAPRHAHSVYPHMHESDYVMHPSTFDNIMQTVEIASVSTDENMVKRLYLPVMFEKIVFNPETCRQATQAEIRFWGDWRSLRGIHGYGSVRTMDGKPMVSLYGMKALSVSPKIAQMTHSSELFPYMRMIWRPDIGLLRNSLSPYAVSTGSTLAQVVEVLRLVAHKNPRVRVLHCGGEYLEECLEALHGRTPYAFYSLYSYLGLDKEDLQKQYNRVENLSGTDDISGKYDVIVAHVSNRNKGHLTEIFGASLKPGGNLVLALDNDVEMANNDLFPGSIRDMTITGESNTQVILQSSPIPLEYTNGFSTRICKLVHHAEFEVAEQVRQAIEDFGFSCQPTSLNEYSVGDEHLTIVLSDINKSLLEKLEPRELESIQNLVKLPKARILWVTAINRINGCCTSSGGTEGFLRSIHTEFNDLNFCHLDLTPGPIDSHKLSLVTLLANKLVRSEALETEYAELDGSLHICRAVIDEPLNADYNQLHTGSLVEIEFPQNERLRIDLGEAGVVDTIHFTKAEPLPAEIGDYEVEVDVKAYTINNLDFSAIMGLFDSPVNAISSEFGGIITKVGKRVTRCQVGQPCGSYKMSSFESVQRVHEDNLFLGEDDPEVLAAMLLSYTTALYALKNLARLEADETVLIHTAAGSTGIAAVEVAQLIGAEVYVTVGSPAKREFMKNNFGIPDSHILNSRTTNFGQDIMNLTLGKGIDVAFNTLSGDGMHTTWNCMAKFGRFVELSRKDILDNGQLDMASFRRDVSFLTFTMDQLADEAPGTKGRKTFAKLVVQATDLYREGKIGKNMKVTVSNISDLPRVIRSFSSGTHIGKLVVRYKREGLVKYRKQLERAQLHGEGSYILVGCLGGLGRELAKYMIERGARNLCFISRTGCDKPAAKELVETLKRSEVRVVVIRGDVSRIEDVKGAVKTAKSMGPLKGVVHAAMVEKDGRFSSITVEDIQAVIQPKLIGALNLHKAVEGEKLDFFFMTSSVSPQIGNPMQELYAAGNSGLDALARYRRNHGLPAVSPGIGLVGSVGYVAENKSFQALISSSGLSSTSMDEIIHMFDHGLRNDLCGQDPNVFNGFDIRRMGNIKNAFWIHNRRFEAVIQAVEESQSSGKTREQSLLPFLHILESMIADNQRPEAIELLCQTICKKVATLFALDFEQIDSGKPITDYGMASLTVVELRSWLQNELNVDMNMYELLDPSRTIQTMDR